MTEHWAHDRADALVPRLAAPVRPVVLVDGPSGAGKTTFAERLSTAWGPDLQVVHLDDVYPGWGGLAAAAAAVAADILRPVDPGYRRWDWDRHEAGAWVRLDPLRPLLVEGCGAITPASAALATARIWCDLDDETRKRRALARDGEVFAAHWDEWAAQEARHWEADHPRSLAEIVVEGAPEDPGDGEPRW